MGDDRLRQTVLDALAGIAPDIDPSGLDPSVNFRDQAELDSVDYLNFVLALERTLDVHIPEQDYPRLSCLSGCVRYLHALTNRPPP
jgi:acyl carrier protein